MTTPNLGLPFILQGQAQKEVTHNEALIRLDALVQGSVRSRTLATPPGSPANGERWIVPSDATRAWAGQTGRIAHWNINAWVFYVPIVGWRYHVEDERLTVVWADGDWRDRIVGTPNGGALRLVALEQELTLTGAFVDATNAVIADRMIVLAVASRTTLAITGATSYGVGVAGNTSQFGGSLGIALGSNNIGVIGPTAFYANTPIRVTAAGGNFSAGRVRVVLYALAFTAPTSVATTPTPTSFTATAGPQGAIPSVTAGPFATGSVIKADPLDYARNGSSLVFEGTTATSESYYVRSEGGDALPSGTIAGNHAAAFSVSTAATQLVAAAGGYAFAPAALFEILPQLEKVTFSGSAIDSAGAISAMFKRTQVVPNPARDYKLRLRAKNHRSLSRPVGRIVSAAKAGSATVTITFDQPHGLTVADLVTVHGIRDQVNFANLATPTAVASVPNATTITIPIGASATTTSYGGVVIRVNGGVFGAPIGQVAQSIARTANVLTVTGSAAWSGLQIGQYINLHGVRDAISGADLGLDGPYRVRDVVTTSLVLEPIGAAPTGADVGTTNCGGAVLPRTDFRVHFIRVMEFTRLITESIGGFGRADQMDAAPVLVTNAVSAVTVTGGVAQDAAAGNPVGIGARAANVNQAAMSATGDLVHLMATMIGALVNKPFSIPEADWTYAPSGVIANTADVVIAAAAGAGIRRYVTAIQVINTNAVATEFVIKDGATVIWRVWLPASMTTPWDIDFPTPLRSSANAALNAAAISSGASIYLDAQGYTAP